jgi:hypothetical protein
MIDSLKHLDRLLRGEVTHPNALVDGKIQLRARNLALLIVLLGATYGLCMGSYSLLKETSITDVTDRYMQVIATTVKVPALFYLSLLVTYPSLYVFNALVGSRLTSLSVLRLLIASLAVNLAVLASLGPIVLFFSISTKSYAFILLLNVVMFAVAGVLGLMFLLQTLHRLTSAQGLPIPTATVSTEDGPTDSGEANSEGKEPSALDMPLGQTLGRHTRLVFRCWVILFAVVGAQMGWVMRPFVGAPDVPFAWFRERGSNFIEAVLGALAALFSGG